jgi:hypothetical protein
MAKDKLTGRVSYRLAGQVFRQVERQAAALDISVNDWCRQAVIEKLKNQNQERQRAETSRLATPAATEQAPAMTRGELILLEEILRVRFLLRKAIGGHLASRDGLTMSLWSSVVEESKGGPEFQETLQKFLEYHGVNKPRK